IVFSMHVASDSNPAISKFAGSPRRARPTRRDVDWDRLGRWIIHSRVLDLVVASIVGRPLSSPQLTDQYGCLERSIDTASRTIPATARRHLIEGLAGTEAKEDTAGGKRCK